MPMLVDASRNELGEERELGESLDEALRGIDELGLRMLFDMQAVMRRLPVGSIEFQTLSRSFAELKAVLLHHETQRRAALAAARAQRQ